MPEDLYINKCIYWQLDLKDNVENRLWLELLHPFAAVKKLYLSEESALRIAVAMTDQLSPSSMVKNTKANVYECFWWTADVAVLPGL
jgi:hypothetical protein